MPLDVTSAAEWVEAVGTALNRYGKLDILVHNGGGDAPGYPRLAYYPLGTERAWNGGGRNGEIQSGVDELRRLTEISPLYLERKGQRDFLFPAAQLH